MYAKRINMCVIACVLLVIMSSSQMLRAQTNSEPNPKQNQQAGQALILPRITAESSTLFDDRVNPPKCSLMSIQVSDVPAKFTSDIHSMMNWPKNYEPPKPYSYSDDDKFRIVADGEYYAGFGQGGGMCCFGKLLVDKGINPLDSNLIWDGKKEGAVHTILGKLTMFDYAFDSNETAPLKFKITKDGYVYLEGKGTVTDLKTGEKHTLE